MRIFITFCTGFFATAIAFAQATTVDAPASDLPAEQDEISTPASDEDVRKLYHESFGSDATEPVDLPAYVPVNSREAREFSNVSVFYTYTPMAVIISGRHGAELDWIINTDWTLSAEYARAKLAASIYDVKIASFTETVYGLHARYYTGNSFNFQFGLGQRLHELKVNADIITSGSNKITATANILHLAMGNRWQWANGFSLGLDWLVLDVPLGKANLNNGSMADRVEDDDDRDDIKDAISTMERFPSVGIARLALGFAF